MQSYSLTVDKFLDHAAKWSGDREVVWPDASRRVARIGYAELRSRSNRLSGALAKLGLAWNTQHHLAAMVVESCRSKPCRWRRPERLTRTGCVPTTPTGKRATEASVLDGLRAAGALQGSKRLA